MAFSISQTDIHVPHPAPANSGFRISYEVTNLGPDDYGHHDHVQVWGSGNSSIIDNYFDAPQSVTNGVYGVLVDVPPLHPGYYDIAITLPDGTSAGTTVIVQ
jgi:hypothetical protein